MATSTSGGSGEWSAKSLTDHFYFVAEQRARAGGRELGPGASSELRGMAAEAAQRLLDEESDDSLDAAIAGADAALGELIQRALGIARDLPHYERTLLGELSFGPAREWFCPRYPFCR